MVHYHNCKTSNRPDQSHLLRRPAMLMFFNLNLQSSYGEIMWFSVSAAVMEYDDTNLPLKLN